MSTKINFILGLSHKSYLGERKVFNFVGSLRLKIVENKRYYRVSNKIL